MLNVISENGPITGFMDPRSVEVTRGNWGMCNFIFLLGPYEELFDSGFTRFGASGWCVLKIAEASDMGMMHSALD